GTARLLLSEEATLWVAFLRLGEKKKYAFLNAAGILPSEILTTISKRIQFVFYAPEGRLDN
ncbi:hypothetical protein AB7W62_19145, partial [Morganella morganii]|uniref:hypothetical protein n=1 Tax=Morganella morganii TaxID=582 RepID=UPI0034E46EF9